MQYWVTEIPGDEAIDLYVCKCQQARPIYCDHYVLTSANSRPLRLG